MDLKIFQATPPWDWPRDAGKTFQNTLTDRRAALSDRLIAAELAGDLVVMNDRLAESLLTIIRTRGESDELRATSAIALGAVLELAFTDDFDEPDEIPITRRTFQRIQDTFAQLFSDDATPKEVRRRILEASVRAPEEWHQDAIAAAYSTGDRDWMLTAVFAMRWIRGFEDQIMDALQSDDPEIHCEAVQAAGSEELAAAWPHVAALVRNPGTPKPLLLAAIGAVADIRPAQAREFLEDLADSRDEEISDAADEAIMMAEASSDEDDEGEWIN